MKKSFFALLLLSLMAALTQTGCKLEKTQEGKVELPKYEVQKTQQGDVQLPKYQVETPKIEIQKKERTVTVPTVKKEEKTIGIPTGIQIKPAGGDKQQ